MARFQTVTVSKLCTRFFSEIQLQRLWFRGKIHDSHSWAPGSSPGWRTLCWMYSFFCFGSFYNCWFLVRSCVFILDGYKFNEGLNRYLKQLNPLWFTYFRLIGKFTGNFVCFLFKYMNLLFFYNWKIDLKVKKKF